MRALAPTPETGLNQPEHSLEAWQFLNALANVRKSEISPLPVLTDILAHEGRQTEFAADSIAMGLSINAEALPGIEENGLPDRVHFQPLSLLGMGRDASKHGVFFGALSLEWFDGSPDRSLQVAVKPSTDDLPQRYGRSNFEDAMQEIAMHQHLNQLGIPTYEPIGTLVVDQGYEAPVMFSMSRFDPVTTMDNIAWEVLKPEQRWEKLGIALNILAALHSNLVFHGDPVFKNLGFGETEGDVRVVDTESSVSAAYLTHPSNVGGGLNRIFQCMSNDFSRLIESVDSDILGQLPVEERPKGVDRFEEHVQHVFVPYYEKLIRTNSPYIRTLKHVLNAVEIHRMRQAEGLE